MVLLCAWYATRAPWLGLTVETQAGGDGVLVKAVAPESPAQGMIHPGAVLAALSNDNGQTIQADILWTLDYPYELTRYADLNRFVTQQQELYELLTQPGLSAILGDGPRVRLDKAEHRPITDLPLEYWLITFIGYGGFLISGGVWCLRRKDIAARLFALSGCGFFFLALGVANFSCRELAVDASILPYLLWGERIGDLLLAYSLCALLWYYPTPLARAPIANVVVLLMALWVVNDALQLYEFPLHAFMLPDFLIPFVFCIIFATLQWRRSHNNPVARASLKWFMLSFFLGSSAVLVLEYMPPVIGVPPLTPLWLEFAAIFIFYLGIALGISRYRLFDLDGWCLNIWLWLVGGIVIVVLDILLISTLALHAGGVLWLVMAIIGWVYFPLRQWLWKYLVRDSQSTIETYFPQLNALFAYPVGSREFDAHWRHLLQQVFEPLHIGSFVEPLASSQIRQDGLVLVVPGIKPSKSVLLTGRSLGQRLFTRVDRQLAEALLELARQSLHQQQAYLENVLVERKRILRDLHDDVASPLMLLVHRAETPEYRKLANTALMALREAVHGLQQTEASPLADVLADWRAEVRERLEAASVKLHWEQCLLPEVTLSPHQRTHLGRVLREAVSNALAHARPQTVKINCDIQNQCLRLLITDDGSGGDPHEWIKRTGLASMQLRVTEMGGEIAWQSGKTKGTSVEVLIPMGILNASTDGRDLEILNLQNETASSVDDAHQPQADGFLRSLSAVADIELTIDGLDMASDGIRRNPE
jgi:signal transduction histidine kinase